jgi:hypothetical protein
VTLEVSALEVYALVACYMTWRKTFMKSALVLTMLLAVSNLFAQQSKNPITDVLREMLTGRAKNTIAAIDAMPADKFNFKPTPDQMTFGHLAAHIADGNYYFCANTADVPRPKADELKGTEEKGVLLQAVRASFDFCKTALEKADDSRLAGDITWFDKKPRARAWAALGLAASWADHYAMAAQYLRLNGIAPPTAQKAKEEEEKKK